MNLLKVKQVDSASVLFGDISKLPLRLEHHASQEEKLDINPMADFAGDCLQNGVSKFWYLK